MLMTLLEYGMQMKLGALSVQNLAKLSHWLEHLLGCHRYKGTDYYLVCSAVGDAIPTMHIFSGQRFWYNPFEGGVSGTYMYMYFSKSEKGNHTTISWLGSQSLDSHFILVTAPF